MRLLFIPVLCLSLVACANPSFIKKEPMLIAPLAVSFDKPSDQISPDDLNDLADQMKRRALSDIDVSVAYASNATLASAQGNKIKHTLQQLGVKRAIHTRLQKNSAIGRVNHVTINFTASQVDANCMGDMRDADPGNYTHTTDSSYAFGCSRDKYLAQMIARPDDLLGNNKISNAQSARQGKMMDRYRNGDPATDSTTSLTASDVYK